MFLVFLLLAFCTALAYLYSNSICESTVTANHETVVKMKASSLGNLSFFLLAVTLILYSGLRTKVNDVANYIRGFERISTSFSAISWSLGDHPLFSVYEIIIKKYLTSSASVFILITSFFVILSYLLFFRKYSENFGLTIYLFISFALYAFTMAAIKQSLAVAVAIWSIPFILNKKYIRALILIVIATLFHPFAFLFLIAFVMKKSIWDRRAVIIIISTIVIGIFFSAFIGQALGFNKSISGNVYTNEDFVSGTGVSFFRIIVYVIPSILSFIYRKQLREVNNQFLNISINLSLVAACFMVLAGLGGANLTGRLAGYFDIFICFSIPATLKYGITSKQTRDIMIIVTFVAFAFYYYSFYYKYALVNSGFFSDFYHHTSLFSVLSSW